MFWLTHELLHSILLPLEMLKILSTFLEEEEQQAVLKL